MTETLSFDDLEPFLLLKNGNYLYKVPFRDGHAVIKVYYGSRSNWVRFTKSFNNVVLLGQTSYWPRTRLKIEKECCELWNKHGFKTFPLYDDVIVKAPQVPEDGYLVFGYVDAPTLEEVLVDESRDIEDRFRLYREWLVEWSRRHDIASAEQEPKLMHENGDFGHVMVLGDGDKGNEEFLWFDLEMVYRSSNRTDEYLWHEVIQYLWYILRKVPKELGDRIFQETIEHYPNQGRLADAHRAFLDPPGLVMKVGRRLDALRKKQQKPTSKFNVARRLHEAMQAKAAS